MKSRLVKKIGKITFAFSNFDSNYQPYSRNQQAKAISKLRIPIESKCSLLDNMVGKVPLKEYRKIKRISPFIAEFGE